MATSIFRPSQLTTNLFSWRKKPEEQQPKYFSPINWSQYQSNFRPSQLTTNLFSWRKKPEEQQPKYFSPINWSQYQSKPAQTATVPPSSPQPSVQPQTLIRKNGGASGTWTVDPLTPFQKMIADKQTQQQTTPPPLTTQTDTTGINPLIAKAREIAQRQKDFYTNQANTQAQQLAEQQDIRNKYADKRVAKLEALRDAAISRINETIPLQEQATNEYKDQLEDQYGRQLKEQAQAQREEQRGIQDLFAGLNTLDSGAFQTQAMKSRERLTANQTATIKARTNELNAADRDLKTFKLQAQQQIANEVQKFDDLLLQIAENMEVGSAEYNAAVKQVYDRAQEAILGIESALAEKEMAYEEKAQALQQEMLLESMKQASNKPLTDKQALSYSANNAIDRIIQTIRSNPNIYRNLNPLSQEKRNYDKMVNDAIDLIIRTRTGAAATKDEVNQMKKLFPRFMDSPETAIAALERLKTSTQSSLMGTPYTNQSQSMGGQLITAPDGQLVLLVD